MSNPAYMRKTVAHSGHAFVGISLVASTRRDSDLPRPRRRDQGGEDLHELREHHGSPAQRAWRFCLEARYHFFRRRRRPERRRL